jgi:hypothetical protein
MRKSRPEQIFSGLPITADIVVWHLRDAAKCQVAIGVTPSHPVR